MSKAIKNPKYISLRSSVFGDRMKTDRWVKTSNIVITVLFLYTLISIHDASCASRDSFPTSGIIVDIEENDFIYSNITLDINSVYNQLLF